MLSDLIAARRLPAILDGSASHERRAALVELLAREVFGAAPSPAPVCARTGERDDQAWGGKATVLHVDLDIHGPSDMATVPIALVLPHATRPAPLLIALTFDPYPCGEDVPIEEVVDRGWGVAVVSYTAVASDDADPNSALPKAFTGVDLSWGRIAMWAYAVSRVVDVVRAMPEVDAARLVVAGHSRLGKTALWAAAQDARLAAAVSNNSGCTGAALARGSSGEQIADITRWFPHWFTPRYAHWAGREAEMPFDQHFLLAAIAPRLVYVSSAARDDAADPPSEFLGCVAASDGWISQGRRGLHHDDRMPVAGDRLHEGDIGYHLRAGTHFHSREDWMAALDFLDRHLPAQPAGEGVGAGPVDDRTTSSGSNSNSLSE